MNAGWQFRRPEYTGENRCIPCTAVNAVLTLLLASLVVGIAHGLGAQPVISVGMGTIVIAVGALSITFRGYLFPGTPALTRRYLPDRVLAVFDKGPMAEHDGTTELDAESLLATNDVVTECDDIDDLCLTDDFEAAWITAIDSRRDDAASLDDLATLLGVDPATLELTEHGEAVLVRRDGRRVGQWESDAAYIADMAAAAVLTDWVSSWGALSIDDRSRILQGLRPFLEACPVCEGQLLMDEETVSSCCRSIEVVAIECTGCDRRLMEMEHPG